MPGQPEQGIQHVPIDQRDGDEYYFPESLHGHFSPKVAHVRLILAMEKEQPIDDETFQDNLDLFKHPDHKSALSQQADLWNRTIDQNQEDSATREQLVSPVKTLAIQKTTDLILASSLTTDHPDLEIHVRTTLLAQAVASEITRTHS